MLLRLAGIVNESVVDGPGLRMVVFVQGCPHHCPGCHNPNSHDSGGGYESSTDVVIAALPDGKLVRGVTLSGGEPFAQAAALGVVAEAAKNRGLSVVTYTGYRFERLAEMGQQTPAILKLLELTDILVDGLFEQERRDLGLAFRGSANQRLIDVPASLKSGQVVEWADPAWKVG
ncbi:MAG: anaerobic ribonucleoside-triphosphate reductase activating protein [Negativicutes bacterium]